MTCLLSLMSIIRIIYMIAHMGWIGLGQNFRKKYGLDLIGSEIDWIGLRKLDPGPTLIHVVQ